MFVKNTDDVVVIENYSQNETQSTKMLKKQKQKKSNNDDDFNPMDIDSEEEDDEIHIWEPADLECISGSGGWNINAAKEFQCCLITILHFVLGGQRKQVIQNMTLVVKINKW